MRRRGGLDRFRLPAAFLVVAIHTGPLGAFTETGDFFLTSVLARVAVPFFLMVTGFFLNPRWSEGWTGVRSTWRKTAGLYLTASLLYLPLMIYKGDFSRENILWIELRDLVFNGTFYHLWYFPALLLALPLALFLIRRLGRNGALCAAGVLYLLGVLGDSWYGLSALVPPLSALYEQLFFFFDYTRNGLFLAPLFLLLGSELARRPELSPKTAAVGLGISFTAMTAEAFWLRSMEWPRHDSMYLTLPVVMVFLFSLLNGWKVPGKEALSGLAQSIYMIHPWSIVLIRGGAKALRLTWLLVDNSIVFYFAVCILTVLLSLCWNGIWRRFRPKKKSRPRRAWIEVDRPALRHNLKELRASMEAGQRMMAVLKAEGYGHGAAPLAAVLEEEGVDAFGTATIEEALSLRRAGIQGMILVLGYVPPEAVGQAIRHRLTLTVVDEAHAAALEAEGKPVHVHWKVDTGMHRLGVPWERLAETVKAASCLATDGVYTHLCVSDGRSEAEAAFTVRQLEQFRAALDQLEQAGIRPGEIHAQASYGLLNYTGVGCTLARVGIALYGVLSDGARPREEIALQPVLALKSRVVSVRTVPAGEGAGYGLAFRAERDSRLAVVSIGYADGVPRSLSGRGEALVRGRRVPFAGRVCMDQLLLDVTELPVVEPGDVVTLIGRDGGEVLSAEAVAGAAGTITNELLSRLGPRLERVFFS